MQHIFDSVLKGMKNNGAPGNDRIRCYWIKKLTSTHAYILTKFNNIDEDKMLFPDWLATSRTILLPKNDLSYEAKNYRPIALPEYHVQNLYRYNKEFFGGTLLY